MRTELSTIFGDKSETHRLSIRLIHKSGKNTLKNALLWEKAQFSIEKKLIQTPIKAKIKKCAKVSEIGIYPLLSITYSTKHTELTQYSHSYPQFPWISLSYGHHIPVIIHLHFFIFFLSHPHPNRMIHLFVLQHAIKKSSSFDYPLIKASNLSYNR